ASQTATQAYSGTISPATISVNCTPSSGPAQVGVAYTATCTVSGGTPGYTWSISAGALPNGINLSGTSGTSIAITGTPTAAVSYSYTVQVTDSASMSAKQTYSGTISVTCTLVASQAAVTLSALAGGDATQPHTVLITSTCQPPPSFNVTIDA